VPSAWTRKALNLPQVFVASSTIRMQWWQPSMPPDGPAFADLHANLRRPGQNSTLKLLIFIEQSGPAIDLRQRQALAGKIDFHQGGYPLLTKK
jgi:hypothetical protein